MASRSFSNVKLVSAFVIESVSARMSSRRGFAAASQGVRSSSAKRSSEVMNKGDNESNKKISWVPDPITGCYRPENRANDINVAELHEALLNNKIRQP